MLVNWFHQQYLLITRAITVNHTHAHCTHSHQTKQKRPQKRPQNRYNLKRVQLHLNACSNRKAINQKEKREVLVALAILLRTARCTRQKPLNTRCIHFQFQC